MQAWAKGGWTVEIRRAGRWTYELTPCRSGWIRMEPTRVLGRRRAVRRAGEMHTDLNGKPLTEPVAIVGGST